MSKFSYLLYYSKFEIKNQLFIIQKALQNVKLADEISISSLAESLEGYNSADVVEFCEQVKMVAIKAEIENKPVVINANDISNVKSKVHTSILQSDIEKMEAFRNSN